MATSMKENHAKMSAELKDKDTRLKIFEIENEDYWKRVGEFDSLKEKLEQLMGYCWSKSVETQFFEENQQDNMDQVLESEEENNSSENEW